jgi:hypothetical protein
MCEGISRKAAKFRKDAKKRLHAKSQGRKGMLIVESRLLNVASARSPEGKPGGSVPKLLYHPNMILLPHSYINRKHGLKFSN